MSLFMVPMAIEGLSPLELTTEAVKIQQRDGVTWKFFSVVYDTKREKYVGWYYGDATKMVKQRAAEAISSLTKEAPNGLKKNNKR